MKDRALKLISAIAGIAILQGCATVVRSGEDNGRADQNIGEGDVDVDGAGGAGTASTSGSSGGAAPTPVTGTAIAFLRSQLPSSSGGSTGSSTSTATGGPTLEPNDLFVEISDIGVSCGDPLSSWGCGYSKVTIGIPPALQVPGVIALDLDRPELFAWYWVSGPDEGGGTCWGGGGSFFTGTIEIVSIDSTQVVVRLEGTEAFELDADGEYTAIRCP